MAMNRPHEHSTDRKPSPGLVHDPVSVFLGAVGWLSIGSGGLLWAIAFTADTASLTLALLVWFVVFVVPSIVAAYVAYRSDDPARTPGAEPPRSGRDPSRMRETRVTSSRRPDGREPAVNARHDRNVSHPPRSRLSA